MPALLHVIQAPPGTPPPPRARSTRRGWPLIAGLFNDQDLSKHILTIHGPQARDQHEYLRQQRAAQRRSATSSADSFTDGDEAVDEEDGSVGAVSEPDEDPSRSAPQIRLVGQHSIASAPRPTESQTPLNLFLSDSAGTSHQHHRPLMNNASGSGAPQPAASRSPYPPPQGSGVAFLLQANQIAERGYHAASAPPAHAAGSPYAGPTMPQYHLDDAKVSVLPPLSQPPSQPPSNDRPAFAPAYSVPQEMSYRPVPMPAAAPAPVLSWRPAPAAGESTSENKMPLARLLNPATPAETLVNALRHSSHRGPLRADETAFCMRALAAFLLLSAMNLWLTLVGGRLGVGIVRNRSDYSSSGCARHNISRSSCAFAALGARHRVSALTCYASSTSVPRTHGFLPWRVRIAGRKAISRAARQSFSGISSSVQGASCI